MNRIRSVCVYCGSSPGRDQRYLKAAHSLGRAIAKAGLGLVYAPEGMVESYVAKGRLRRVLEDWCQPYAGYHLFYPSRRQSSAAFSLVVDTLRHRDSRDPKSPRD